MFDPPQTGVFTVLRAGLLVLPGGSGPAGFHLIGHNTLLDSGPLRTGFCPALYHGELLLLLTLSADDDDGDVGALRTQLAVELIELLETGLVLQAEDQDHRIHPAAELQRNTGTHAAVSTLARQTTNMDIYAHTRACASGEPDSSRISNR